VAEVAMTSFADKPTITGERVVLRPMVAGDFGDVWADLQDPEATRLTGTHDTFDRDRIAAYCADRCEQPDRLDLAAVDAQTGAWLGEVVINEWDSDNHSCSFRIALSAGARNRGLGTEATRLIVGYVFDEIDDPAPVNRLSLEVFDFNERAAAVYEKVGFIREGVQREALFWDGVFHDAITMSILRRDRASHQGRC